MVGNITFYDFCCFLSVAVKLAYKLLLFKYLFIFRGMAISITHLLQSAVAYYSVGQKYKL